MALQGLFDYPGIEAWESFSISDVSGISPAIGLLEMYPQYGIPSADGDITLSYGGNKIVFRNCHIDAASYKQGSGGQTVTVRFFDERWRWQFASISLRANQRLPDGFVNPLFEASPQQLAAACFESLGVQNFDVSALPNDARPEVDWDNANPAQELARMCDDFGCRIVPRRSDGAWVICVSGTGASLPSDLPYNDAGEGINPKEIPDYIKIITAPIRVQMAVELEAAAYHYEQGWMTLPKFKTFANPQSSVSSSRDGFNPFDNFNINATRFRMPDGTRNSWREIADQHIFRSWRIKDAEPFGKYNISRDPATHRIAKRKNRGTISIPGYKAKVFRKQILLTNELVDAYRDAYGHLHNRPAFLFGVYRGFKAHGGGNYPFGRRIDAQTGRSDQLTLEDRTSFSLNCDQQDADKTVIRTSTAMIRVKNPEAIGDFHTTAVKYDAARLWIMTAVNILNLDTWQPERFEYFHQIGNGTNKDFCHVVIRNDIQPYFKQNYPLPAEDATADELTLGELNDNSDDVKKQCAYYAESIAKTFQVINTQTRNYIGLFSIDMDGSIQQISYRISKSGADTVASLNSEHDFDIPQYGERRQRDGRSDPFKFKGLLKEITDRDAKLRGTYNT